MGSSTGDADVVHLHVRLGGAVAVEADTHTTAEVHGDLAEHEAVGAREAETKVGRAGHGEVGNLDIVCVGDFDGTTARAAGGVDGTATFEDLAGLDGDGVGANGARSNDRHTLAGADGVDSGLDSGTVVGSSVDVGGAASRCERATRASDLGIGCAGTALGGNGRDERQRRSEKGEVNHCCDDAIDVDDLLV